MARLKTFKGFSVKKQFRLENGMIRVKLYDVDISPDDWDKFSGDTYFDSDNRRDIAKTSYAEGKDYASHQRHSGKDDPAVRQGRPSGRRTGGGKLAAR